jgi:hypothetical protein
MRDGTDDAAEVTEIERSWAKINESWRILRSGPGEPAEEVPAHGLLSPSTKGSVIFSLLDGQVWVSWTGVAYRVKLGCAAEVEAMMRDYLKQSECADRLLAAARSGH